MPSLLYDACTVDIQSLNPRTDFVILMLGKTGSGKTSFIRHLTGTDFGVNTTLKGEVTEIKMAALSFPSTTRTRFRLVFIDTPGFDQKTTWEDIKVEQRISKHLEDMKKVGVAINTIVYLVAIDDPTVRVHYIEYKKATSTLNPDPSASVESFGSSIKSNTPPSAIERLFYYVSKWRTLYHPDSDQQSLFLLTTNWHPAGSSSEIENSLDTTEWEDLARADLASKWKEKVPATAKLCFQLDRLADTVEDASRILAEIVSTSQTSLAFGIAEEIEKATTHATQALSQFRILSDTLTQLRNKSQLPSDAVLEAADAHLTNQDVIIAVMGPTGSGKSSFIKAVSGVDPGVNKLLESSQMGVKIITMKRPDISTSRIVLVDTPGFDDTNRSDLHIFQLISRWLENSYGKDVLLNGIIYMHRITDNRMAGSPLKNISMFQKLCGRDAFSRVTFVTTMWNELDIERKILDDREKELEQHFLKTFTRQGAKVRRHETEGDRASAIAIISDFTADRKKALLLQRELVDYKKTLQETQAGQEMYTKLELLIQEQQTAANNHDNEESKREIQSRIDLLQRDLQQLKLPLPPALYNFFYWIWHGVPWQATQEYWSKA